MTPYTHLAFIKPGTVQSYVIFSCLRNQHCLILFLTPIQPRSKSPTVTCHCCGVELLLLVQRARLINLSPAGQVIRLRTRGR